MLKEELQIEKREQLPLLLKKLGLSGAGAEIGVQTGIYSAQILKLSGLSRLYSIDCWKHTQNYQDIANKNNLRQIYYYIKTKIGLRKFGKRSIILKKFSEDAAKLFKDESLDFVYIDANHSYAGAKKDIEIWWPKVKSRGVLAGHDYILGMFPEGNIGVKKAIDEFVKRKKLKLFVTKETKEKNKTFPSWYLIKEEN